MPRTRTLSQPWGMDTHDHSYMCPVNGNLAARLGRAGVHTHTHREKWPRAGWSVEAMAVLPTSHGWPGDDTLTYACAATKVVGVCAQPRGNSGVCTTWLMAVAARITWLEPEGGL
jgi:hypothetical protein